MQTKVSVRPHHTPPLLLHLGSSICEEKNLVMLRDAPELDQSPYLFGRAKLPQIEMDPSQPRSASQPRSSTFEMDVAAGAGGSALPVCQVPESCTTLRRNLVMC